MGNRRLFTLGLAAALALSMRSADAQSTAVGPYYATPSWDQTLACSSATNCPRFVVLSNFAGKAILDRETGLVWQRQPSSVNSSFRSAAVSQCMLAATGGRQGWRLPRVDELMSLADATNSSDVEVHLPAGHPFQGITTNSTFWAADRIPANLTDGAIIVFFTSSQPGGYINHISSFQFPAAAWCVRGGGGSQIE
jgi:hypothetical protein